MHGGFYNMRSALPMNLRARYPGFRVFTGAKGDIRRVLTIWNECFDQYGGRFLFGDDADAGGRHVRAGLHPLCHL